jgi:hypothetical protein
MALCASRNMSVARATRQTAAPARVAARQVVRASRRNAVVVNAAAPLVGSKAPAFKATAGESTLETTSATQPRIAAIGDTYSICQSG